jgi:hypothetical protein
LGVRNCPTSTQQSEGTPIHTSATYIWRTVTVAHTHLMIFVSRFKKGANRWCTMMYHTLKTLKESGTPAARARHLVMVGDNYAENKNNTNLDFCSEMVQRGWFDTIELLYGYVRSPPCPPPSLSCYFLLVLCPLLVVCPSSVLRNKGVIVHLLGLLFIEVVVSAGQSVTRIMASMQSTRFTT